MKKWNIESKKEDKIFDLLNEYSKSLSVATNNVLLGDVLIEVNDNIIHYLFIVKNNTNSFRIRLFDISLPNLKGSLKLLVEYLDDSRYFNISESQLEGVIDDIISSERMSTYINYLVRVSSKIS